MSLFAELRRRNIFKVGIAYVVASWLILQLTEVLTELLELEADIGKIVILLLVVGFIPALIFAWAFEMTPEGLKREKDLDRSESIARHTGRKLDFVIIGMLAVGMAYFFWESRIKGSEYLAPEASRQVSVPSTEKGTLTPAASSRISIAVLPFANRSNQEDDLFFTDGIHDDLLTQLGKMGDLQVISRTSVMEYRDTTKKIPEIAAELGVTKILEGGVQRAGKRIRINAQLIDVETDAHLWSETFDREMTVENIFDIQSEITRRIVLAVRGELSPEESLALDEMPTDNLEAYEAFLRARSATNLADYGRDKYVEAEPWARRATQLDPDFGQAWALLAEIHGQAVWLGYDRSGDRQEQARAALGRALELAPDDSTVIAARADQLYRLENDYPAAYALYQKARARAPNDARIVLFQAITERRLGLWEESVATFEEAHDLDPANVFIVAQWADTLWRMKAFDRLEPLLTEWLVRYPESRDLQGIRALQLMHQHGDLKAAREVFDLIPPSSNAIYNQVANDLPRWERNYAGWRTLWELPELNTYRFSIGDLREFNLGIAFLLDGDEESGRRHLRAYIEQMEKLEPQTLIESGYYYSNLAIAHAWLGENAEALELAEQAVAVLPPEDDALFGSAQYRAQTWVLGMAGRYDEAVGRLAGQLDQPEGFSSWELVLDPYWDFLRGNPAFDALIAGKRIREGGR